MHNMNYYQQLPGGQYQSSQAPPPPPSSSASGQPSHQHPMYSQVPNPAHQPPNSTTGIPPPPSMSSQSAPTQGFNQPQAPPQSHMQPASHPPQAPSATSGLHKQQPPSNYYSQTNAYGASTGPAFVDQPLNDVPLQNSPERRTGPVSADLNQSSHQPHPSQPQQYAAQPPYQGDASNQSYSNADLTNKLGQLSLDPNSSSKFPPSSASQVQSPHQLSPQSLSSQPPQPIPQQTYGTNVPNYSQPPTNPSYSSNQPSGYSAPPQSLPPSNDQSRSSSSFNLSKNRYPQPSYGVNQPPQPQQPFPGQPPMPDYGMQGGVTQPPMSNYPPPQTGNYGQMPPSPGYGQQPPPAGQYGYGAPGVQQHAGYGQPQNLQQPMRPPQQQQHQIDPDSIPSVVEVEQEDRARFAAEPHGFTSGIPSAIPPLHTTIKDILKQRLQTHDAGSARPQFMRSSLYRVPVGEDLLKSTGMPFNVIIQPFDQGEVDIVPELNRPDIIVPVTESEISRCNRCKAYMSPFMRFIDGGKRFQCAMCNQITEVSDTYFAHLDHTGQRLDKYQRCELHLGSYEFRATAEFFRNTIQIPRRPHIIFAFELTHSSRPLIAQLSQHLAEVIRSSLPIDPANQQLAPPLVGFIGYNSKILFFDVANDGVAHVLCDVASTFPPFTNFLVDPIQQLDRIEAFLQKLPEIFMEQEIETESILGPVIEAAFQTAAADNNNWFGANPPAKDADKVIPVGKIYLFHCTLPTYGQDGVTPGRLKPRWTSTNEEARRLLGTEKEKQILTPEPSKYYSELSQRCVTDYGSGVELFLFPPVNGSFVDVATISELCRLTGTGGIHKYFNDYSTRFLHDLRESLRATMAFDVVFKVRTSAGLRPVDYVGHFLSRSVNDIECASLNAGNSISVEIKYDDKLQEDDYVYLQAVALYTSVGGERRIRVHNLSLPVCSKYSEIYKFSSCDTIINHLLRTSVTQLRLGEKTVQQVKEALINRTVVILTTYRKQCAQPGSTIGQLVLPETLKLLPVYLTGMIKVDAIDGGPEMLPDDKAYAQIRTLGANVDLSHTIVYPRLLSLKYNEQQALECSHQRCAAYRLNDPNVVAYILENGFYLFMYLPALPDATAQNSFVRNVFGVDSVAKIDTEKELPLLDNPDSEFVNQIIDDIQALRHKAMKLYVIRQNLDKNELIFKCFLYEDKKLQFAPSGAENNKLEAPSYVDLLCHLHKEIRAQLN